MISDWFSREGWERHPSGDLNSRQGLVTRFFAAFADVWIFLIALALLTYLAYFLLNPLGLTDAQSASDLENWNLALVGFFIYYIAFEAYLGYTPGKKLLGIVVTDVDGSPIGLKKGIIRNILRLIDMLPFNYILGAISIWATDSNQRIGDLAAGTVVVKWAAKSGEGSPSGPSSEVGKPLCREIRSRVKEGESVNDLAYEMGMEYESVRKHAQGECDHKFEE